VSLLSSSSARTLGSDLHLRIEDARFDNGAAVTFLETSSIEVAVPSETLGRMVAGQTQDKRFTVFTSVDEITVYPAFENYVFYVRSASASSDSPVTRFTIQAVPYDAFPDQLKRLFLHLEDGVKDWTVDMSLPVHSLKSGNFLSARPDALAKIHLSGDTISVDLVNNYHLPVKITDAAIDQVSDSHWLSQPKLQKTLPIVLGSDENNNHVTLVWSVEPRAWGILRDSLMPFSKTGESENSDPKSEPETFPDAADRLEISVYYVPAQGGFPHPIKVYRSVYFYPSFFALVSVSILGALVAAIVMFFGVRKDSGLKKFLRYLSPNIGLALVVQLIAIVLFSFDNSKIQIGVVNLNPTLLIPAFCLGAISVFLGFKVIEKWFEKWLTKAGPEPAEETPEGA